MRRCLLVVLLLAGACAPSTRPGGLASITAAPDPWQPPAPLTPGYLRRVLQRLDRTTGDGLRAEGHGLVDTAKSDLAAVYLPGPAAGLLSLAAHGTLRVDPGDPTTGDVRILDDQGNCAFVEATRSFNPDLTYVISDSAREVGLVRGGPASGLNPTGWRITLDALASTAPSDPCPA